jgi:YidC/Oxa1 family membrane protein insertase
MLLRHKEPNRHRPELSFEYSDADVSVRKTFRFNRTYEIHVDTLVVSKGSQITAFPLWPAGFGDSTRPAAYGSSQIEYQNNGSVERLAIKKISGGNTLPGPFNWAAVTDQYFTVVFIPENVLSTALLTLHNTMDVPKNPQKPDPKETQPVPVLGAAVGSLVGPTSLRMYVGPKSLDTLEAVSIPTISGASQDLRGIVNFGFFNIIARPLFQWLKWTHAHIVANWGWAIVIQTLIINIVLLPLRIYPDEVCAENAEDPAADQGHPGKIQEVQHARSQEAGDAEGNLGPATAGRRQHVRRLSADVDPTALPVRLLQHVERVH